MKITKRIRKVPTVLQVEAVECAAASLSMILQYYGTYLPLERLRIECGVSRDGAKASNIVKAAEKFGLHASGFKCNPEDLATLPLPAIIHWNFNHFLVLEGCRGNRFYLNDPACGRRSVNAKEFDESFTGVVITFEKKADFKPQGKPTRLFPMLKPLLNIEIICLMFLSGLALTFPGILLPLLSQFFLDKVIAENHLHFGVGISAVFIITAFLRCLLQNVQASLIGQIQIRSETKIGAATIWKILHLPQSFFSQRYPGEIIDKAMICNKVAKTISTLLSDVAVPLFMMIFSLALMMFYSIKLSLICITVALCNIIILHICTAKIGLENQKTLLAKGKLIGVEMSGLQIIETLKACGMEDNFFRRWCGLFSKVQNSKQKLIIFRYILLFIPNFLSSTCYIILLIYGGILAMNNSITPGILVAFFLLSSEFLSPVEHLSKLSIALQELKIDLLRLADILNYPKNKLIDSTENDITKEKTNFAVKLENVSFGYNLLEPPLIEKMSFELQYGESIAFVGDSGTGKSTIAKLINGSLLQWNGNIVLLGKKLNAQSKDDLSELISSIDQDICMFEASIFDNITLWDTTKSMNEVIQAAKDACIHDVILHRPGEYNSPVEENGRNFSGGEIQRLEIARALVTNPKILIMDEATSALDAETEHRICENIKRRGCTCIIVAHRLSTIKICEKIAVLNHGKIESIGNHEQLLKNCESYKKLVSNLQDSEV